MRIKKAKESLNIIKDKEVKEDIHEESKSHEESKNLEERKNPEESKNPEQEKISEETTEKKDNIIKEYKQLDLNKNEINADSLIMLFSKIYDCDNLYQILFKDIPNNIDKEEYLEMILLFLPEKNSDQILSIINNNLDCDKKVQIHDIFMTIFRKIDLKTEKGFQFLKEILLEYLKDKFNIANSIKEIEKKYIMHNKMLRCTQCFDLPCFSVNSQGTINLSYECKHIKSTEGDKLKEISEHKFQCKCKKLVFDCYKNYICSNCKSIVCSLCVIDHFKKCISLFLIQTNEIDNHCSYHYEKYEEYCGLCNKNLCKKCVQEHYHCVKKIDNLSEKNITKFNDKIKNDSKNSSIILSAIENIMNEKLYKCDFRFIIFVNKILGISTEINAKLFKEFFDDDFQNYYKHMINEITQGNFYFLNVLSNMQENYKVNDPKYALQYLMFCNKNASKQNKNTNKIMSQNTMKFSLLTKYFNIIYDVKVQKQLLDYAKEIKNGLINIKENHILIKCISSSESIYKQELLKLIDRSIAENIIVLLIEKFYRNFKTFDLNLNVLSDLEHYYKDEPEKFNKIKNSNKEKIDKLLEDKKNNEPNKNANKMYFNSPISTANQNISVDELNQMLEFLFYIKEQGNFTAHPKNIEPVVINPNSHEYKISTKNENLDDIRRKMRDFLTKEFKNKSFLTPIKPAYAFECIFESKFNHLINSSDNKDINNNINNILEQALSQMNELKRDETIFDNIIERINKLEEIYKSFMAEEINEKDINIPKSLGNFFKRVSKILEHENEENCISFLYELNQKQFENSVTGENCVFFSMCLNYIIYKILPEIKSKINNLKKMTENARNLIKSKDEIIFFLTNLNSKLGSMDEFNKYESIIDPKKIAEYFNKSTNNSIKGEIDLGKIRDNLSKLVTSSFDWTSTKNCKLSTLLYLKQNNK